MKINIGIVWGIGLGLLLLLAVAIYIKKRIRKEAKTINVKRPDEEDSEWNNTTDTGNGRAEPDVDERIGREKFKGLFKKRRGFQVDPSKADRHIEQGSEQYSPATLPPEPFKY